MSRTGRVIGSGLGVALGAILIPGAVFAQNTTILVGSASGSPGEVVKIEVVLGTDMDISDVTLVVDYDSPIAVQADSSNRPDCTVNPAINKPNSQFVFMPLGCATSGDCTSVDVGITSLSSSDPIPNNSVLYTCQVGIAANAAPGNYELRCGEAMARPPSGSYMPVSCEDGLIAVQGGGPTVTPTRTPAPMRADDDGCQIHPAPHGPWGWSILAGAVVLLVRRRRRAR